MSNLDEIQLTPPPPAEVAKAEISYLLTFFTQGKNEVTRMNPNLEIRKLPIKVKSELVKYLEDQECWKKLMGIVPEVLRHDEYQCDITSTNPAKYRSEDFYTIQNASFLTKRFCSEIFLREWGTSGRVRPALGHLKYLLEKAQLFHAADYVTVNLLKQERSSRPIKGPGAPIVFNFEELEDSETKRIEKPLDELDYPSSAIQNINQMNSVNTNLNYTTKEIPKVIPKILTSKSPEIEEPKPFFNVPLIVQSDKVKSESDLIKFSTNDYNVNVPDFSSLLRGISSNKIPLVVASMTDSTSSDIPFENNRPNLTSLLRSLSTDNVPALRDLNLSRTEPTKNFPALSELLAHGDSKSKILRP